MQPGLITPQQRRTDWGWPLLMAYIRLPLILIGGAAGVLALRLAGSPLGIRAGAVWSTLSVTAANVVCLVLLLWRARVENLQLREIVGFRRRRSLRDLAVGVLWSMVLFALLMAGLFATMLAVQGIAGLTFEQAFGGEVDIAFDPPQWLTVVMLVNSVVVFPVLNAPVEELQYRGYAQPGLIAASRSAWLGICVTAIGFGLQHVTFAITLPLALGLFVGFTAWGFGAGVIYHRQQRLAPLIVAHFISNLSFGFMPLYFMLGGA